jgi:hypothetical protein
MNDMQKYSITITVQEDDKEKIIDGIKGAIDSAEVDLISAAKYGCDKEQVWKKAELLNQLRTAHHHLGFRYEWEQVIEETEDDQI